MSANNNGETITLVPDGNAIPKGALVEIESAKVTLWDGTGSILGTAINAFVSGDATFEVEPIVAGTILNYEIETALTAVSGSTTNSFCYSMSGCPDDALIGMEIVVDTCAGTPAASGDIYVVTDNATTANVMTLTVAGNVSTVFATGDTAHITNLEQTTLKGVSTVAFNADRNKVDFDGAVWNGTQFMITGINTADLELKVKSSLL